MTPSDLPRLHVIVDSVELARAALDGGTPLLQVRVKDVSDRERFERTAEIADLCRTRGATCIVNDRADVAFAVGADGVHVGADDLPVTVVRQIVGSRLLIGGTARDPATARRLVAASADYLGVGPCYPTASKNGLPEPGGPERVRAVASAVDVPVVAIAGITADRVPELVAAGAWGVAVISAVRDADDPAQATKELLAALDEATYG
ncbi:MAG: thiamine phosphate synthase [Acidimicrobiales bacterium]